MTDLSLGAQAVLDAYQFAPIEDELTAAAVLRAAACQLTSAKAINTLRAIADELEAQVMEKPVTDQQHPITPPPELVQQWSCDCPLTDPFNRELYVATLAARWGADCELDACCEWMGKEGAPTLAAELRSSRRPKPPSLKEQALGALYAIATGADNTREFHQDIETIKAALEQLDD